MTQVEAGAQPLLSGAAPRRAGTIQGITLVTVAFLPIVAIVSMFPAVPAIIEHFAARDPGAIGRVPAMVSAPGLMIAILSLFAGFFVDRFGRRRLLLISTGLYGLVGAIPFLLDDLNQITLSRYALGIAEAAILTTLNTLVGDYWDAAGRRFWLTVQGICGPFLGSVVIFAAGYLTHMQWNAIFLIYLVGFPAFIACALFLFEPQSDATVRQMLGMDEDQSSFPWKGVASYGFVTLLGGALYYVFIINGGIVWSEIGVKDPAEIGKMTTIPSLFVMAGAGVFWLTGKAGARWQLFAMFGFLGTGLITMGLIHDWRGMVVGMALQQTGAGMAVPCLIDWAQSHLPYAHRGRGMGIWTACFFLGQFTSPLLVSLIRQAMGSMQGAFWVAGVFGLACALLTIFVVSGRSAEAAAA
jgi:MFS family permease